MKTKLPTSAWGHAIMHDLADLFTKALPTSTFRKLCMIYPTLCIGMPLWEPINRPSHPMYDLSRKKTKLSFSPSCFLTLSDIISISREILSFSLTQEGLSSLDYHSAAFSKKKKKKKKKKYIYIYIYIYISLNF